MHSNMIETMETDALFDLYAGIVTPVDREILKDMPLPDDMVDPFASQDVEPLALMNLNYVSLSGWIAEARKEKYYSERFAQLSKLVMKGVTTMGRGLVTLHQRGEDLSAAPMQIDDLISVGSYHFRKSYLGVVQFSAKHPEIGERLLVNQLGWSTTLMRLYKTKEKLTEAHGGLSPAAAKPAQVTVPGVASLPKNEEGSIQYEELPDGKADNSSFFIHNSSLNNDSSLDADSSLDEAPVLNAMSALFEPASFSAHRALTPIRNSECGMRNTELPGNKKSETRNKKSETRNKKSDSYEEVRMKNEEKKSNAEFEMRNAELPENKESETLEYKKSDDNEERNIQNEENLDTDHQPLTTDSDSELNEDALPPYIRILQNAFGRSEPNDEGRLTFTFDEVRCLAADPEFARVYPEAAADMRKMAQHIDSG